MLSPAETKTTCLSILQLLPAHLCIGHGAKYHRVVLCSSQINVPGQSAKVEKAAASPFYSIQSATEVARRGYKMLSPTNNGSEGENDGLFILLLVVCPVMSCVLRTLECVCVTLFCASRSLLGSGLSQLTPFL